jgi:hypothetical protein
MRTAATAKCIIASATLVVVVVPAERGTLNDASKATMAIPVQIVRARAKRLSRRTSKPHPARDAVKLLRTTEAMPTP